jgi:cell division protein FtsQ
MAGYDGLETRFVQSFRAKKRSRKATSSVVRHKPKAPKPSNRRRDRRRTTASGPRNEQQRSTRSLGKIPPSGRGPIRRVAASFARIALRVGIVGGLAYGALVGVREGYEYATTSPRFEVRGLLFEPTAHVTDEELRELMALPPGTNILSLDLDEVALRVVGHRWVARATVTRVLPDTLDVQVIEHEPAAVLLAGTFYLVDDEGRPFKVLEENERGALPVVTGFDRLELLGTPEDSHHRIRRALEVLREYGKKRRPRLSEVHVDDGGATTLYTAELGSQLRVGRGDVAAALSRFDALRAALGEESDKLAVAHLDATFAPERAERVVASFFPTQEVPSFVVDAEEKTRAKAAQDEAARESDKARRGHDTDAPGRKKRSRLPSYE